MTAWSLWCIDISRHWVFSLVMVYQARPAAIFSPCLFWGLFAFSLLFSTYSARSIGFRFGDWLSQWRIFHLLAVKNPFVALAVCFGSCCIMKCSPISLEEFGFIWANIQAQAITPPPPCFTDKVVCFGFTGISHTSPHIPLYITLVHVILCLICPHDFVTKLLGASFRCFFRKL